MPFRIPLPVVLASASPRRQELLRKLVEDFEVLPAAIEEHERDDPWDTAKILARDKARAVSAARPGSLVIGGDTVVAVKVDDQCLQLAKPTDQEDAARMLRLLSGREHFVITGLALVWPGGERVASDTTIVHFKPVTESEIREYSATGEPFDKAGGYGIQGGASPFIERIEGSYSNVVGLPVELLRGCLSEAFPQ